MAPADPKKDPTPPAADAKPERGPTARYNVLTRLEKDGKTYEPGDTVSLDKVSAKPLLEVRCVEAAGKD